MNEALAPLVPLVPPKNKRHAVMCAEICRERVLSASG
jgi:hypothetical protein